MSGKMIFEDYSRTKRLYHVVSLTDLAKCLSHGITFDDKKTYKSKYYEFHGFFDMKKPAELPAWVVRSNAIFASMNLPENHKWHSHTAVLSVRIDESRCWVCNENIANSIYEAFILQGLDDFKEAKWFVERLGNKIAADYWKTSCSFIDNLMYRNDMIKGYDAEVLVMHHIPPEDINCELIISDHRVMSCHEWKQAFLSDNLEYDKC
ncbi:MAG: hypothetical protein ACOZCL_07340 [Bacillota bacterium]